MFSKGSQRTLLKIGLHFLWIFFFKNTFFLTCFKKSPIYDTWGSLSHISVVSWSNQLSSRRHWLYHFQKWVRRFGLASVLFSDGIMYDWCNYTENQGSVKETLKSGGLASFCLTTGSTHFFLHRMWFQTCKCKRKRGGLEESAH